MDKENPNYYSIITADVRYDKRLTTLQKLLYSEITALSNKYGYCYASNKYFANLYDKTPHYISTLITGLVELGYLTSVIDKENGNNRKLYINQLQKENEKGNTKEIDLLQKSDIPITKNCNTYNKKLLYINIKHNTKHNIKESKEKENQKISHSKTKNPPYKKENVEFYEKIINTYNGIEGRPAVRGFKSWAKNCDYWLKSEENPDGYTKDDILKAIFHILLCKKKWDGQISLELLFRQKDTNNNQIDRIADALLMQVPYLENTGFLKGSHLEAHKIYNERYRQ